MNFGIPAKSMEIILSTLGRHREIEQAAIFGSRALGNYRNGSDIDIVIYGSGVKPSIADSVRVSLNEDLPLPYYFDIVHYDSLGDEPLKEHIDQFARVIYPGGPQ